MLRFLLAISLVLVSQMSFAVTSNSCEFEQGSAKTNFSVLQTGEFSVHYPDSIQTIFSCGPFVNDGSVVIEPNSKIIELSSNTCGSFSEPGLLNVIYCL